MPEQDKTLKFVKHTHKSDQLSCDGINTTLLSKTKTCYYKGKKHKAMALSVDCGIQKMPKHDIGISVKISDE